VLTLVPGLPAPTERPESSEAGVTRASEDLSPAVCGRSSASPRDGPPARTSPDKTFALFSARLTLHTRDGWSTKERRAGNGVRAPLPD
jgi:hypothetical protein